MRSNSRLQGDGPSAAAGAGVSELDEAVSARVASVLKPQPLLRKASYGAGIHDHSQQQQHGGSGSRVAVMHGRSPSSFDEGSAAATSGPPPGGSPKPDRTAELRRSGSKLDDSGSNQQRAVIRRSGKASATGTTRMASVAAAMTATTSPSASSEHRKTVGPARTQQLTKEQISKRPPVAGGSRPSDASSNNSSDSAAEAPERASGFSGYFRSWMAKPSSKQSSAASPVAATSQRSFSDGHDASESNSYNASGKGAWAASAPGAGSRGGGGGSSGGADNGVRRFEEHTGSSDPFAAAGADDASGSRSIAQLADVQVALERKLLEGAEDVIARRRGPTLASISRKGGGCLGGGIGSLFFSPKDGMTLVTNNIVLGARADAEDLKAMRGLGISYVLNISDKVPNHFPDVLVYRRINIPDNASVQLKDHFSSVSAFIRRAEARGGRVLVHCVAGASRSVAYVIMHLVAVHRIRLEDAWNHIIKLRPFISPNEGFLLQLAMFEYETLGGLSVSSRTSKHWNFYAINELMARLPRSSASSAAATGPRDPSAMPLGEEDDDGAAAKCMYWLAA